MDSFKFTVLEFSTKVLFVVAAFPGALQNPPAKTSL
jgi:hypothetical protein